MDFSLFSTRQSGRADDRFKKLLHGLAGLLIVFTLASAYWVVLQLNARDAARLALPPHDLAELAQHNTQLVFGIWTTGLTLLLVALGWIYNRSKYIDIFRERESRIRQTARLAYWRLNLDTQQLELGSVIHKSLDLYAPPESLWEAWLATFDNAEQRTRLQSAVDQAMHDDSPFSVEVRMHNRTEGLHGWGLITGAGYTDARGRRWVEGTAQDITARKNAELEAEQFRNKLGNIVDWSRLGVWEFDLIKGERHINRYLRDMLGLETPMTGEYMVFDWSEISHPDDLPAALQARQDYLSGLTPHYSARLRVKHQQGHWVSFLLAGAFVAHDEHGQPTLIRGTAIDVTELMAAREKAEAASQAKTQFLSRMSHELRSPLNSITGYGQFLRMDERLQPDQKEHIEAMLVGARHLLNLINDLLQITQDDSAQTKVQLQSVELAQLSQRCVVLMRPLIEEKKQLLVNEVPTGSCVLADPLRMQQVIINLLANAIKYSDDQAVITLSASTANNWVTLSVRDMGPGIPPHIGEQVFEPFFRQQHHESSEGAGLGLAVTRRLVQQMQGRISFESAPSVGTVFHVSFPQARALASPEPAQPRAASYPWHASSTV